MSALVSLPKPVKPERLRRVPPRRRTRIRRSQAPMRKSRPRRMSIGERAEIFREATRVASAICRTRAGGWCESPGCHSIGSDAAHALGKKAHPSIRFELSGLLWLCRRHHLAAGNANADGRPSPMLDLYLRLRGLGAWGRLVEMAGQSRKFTPETLDDLKAQAAGLGIDIFPKGRR